MGDRIVGSIAEALEDLAKHVEQSVRRGVRKAARSAASTIRRDVPRAFGELADSIHVEDTAGESHSQIVADAPHAAPIETGSRPHWPPLAPLIAWVRLRGMQGLTKGGGVIRSPRGIQKRIQLSPARQVAQQIAALRKNGATPIDAPEQIARQIQRAIGIKGTKPHWFMRASLPMVRDRLDDFIRAELART